MYAFGGEYKLKGNQKFESEFFYPCSGDPSHTNLNSIKEIEEVYKFCVENTELGKSYEITPILDKISQKVKEESLKDSDYYKLIFITSPVDISDSDEFQRKFVEYSHLPMSIIFIEASETQLNNLRRIDPEKPVKIISLKL